MTHTRYPDPHLDRTLVAAQNRTANLRRQMTGDWRARELMAQLT